MAKPIFVIFEGIDRIGKTTSIQEILNLLEKQFTTNEEPIEVSYYKDQIQLNSLGEYTPATFLDQKHSGVLCGTVNMALMLSNEPPKIVLFDRHHISGAVYGKVLRNNDAPTEFNKWYEETLPKAANVILVTFVLDDKAIIQDEVVDIDSLNRLNEEFLQQAINSQIPQKIICKLRFINDEGKTNIHNFVAPIYGAILGAIAFESTYTIELS